MRTGMIFAFQAMEVTPMLLLLLAATLPATGWTRPGPTAILVATRSAPGTPALAT
jgi:hypothetical protein